MVNAPAFWPSAGWVALGVLVQTVLAPELTLRSAAPSFVTIGIVLYALQAGARRGAMLGLIGGALTDVFAGSPGGWTIAETVMGCACGSLTRVVFADSALARSAVVAGAIIVRNALFWTIAALEGYPRGYGTLHLHTTVWQAFLTAGCTILYVIARARMGTVRTHVERFP